MKDAVNKLLKQHYNEQTELERLYSKCVEELRKIDNNRIELKEYRDYADLGIAVDYDLRTGGYVRRLLLMTVLFHGDSVTIIRQGRVSEHQTIDSLATFKHRSAHMISKSLYEQGVRTV